MPTKIEWAEETWSPALPVVGTGEAAKTFGNSGSVVQSQHVSAPFVIGRHG